MRKMLLLAATLSAMAVIPPSASAHDAGWVHRHVGPPFGIKIIVRDAPKVVQHHRTRHLRPQPWHRHFKHHAPRWRWHKPRPPSRQHFDRHRGGHQRWFRAPGRPLVKDGDKRHRLHGPGPERGLAVRHRAPHERSFKHGQRHDRRRHR